MATLLSGKEAAGALMRELAARGGKLRAAGVLPTLAVVRVGAREADLAYERGAAKRCAAAGVDLRSFALPQDVAQDTLIRVVSDISADPSIHGCLLLRPLPDGIDDRAVCAALKPEKDVDGVTAASMAAVYSGAGTGFAPCTAEACLALLDHFGIPCEGKHAVVIGRSPVVGRPAAMLLLRRNATITVCHSRTRGLGELCRQADILVAAVGKPGFVGADFVRPGAVVLDVGIHVGADGKLCGDVDFPAVEPIAAAISPVPGGVGALTSALLLRHLLDAILDAPAT